LLYLRQRSGSLKKESLIVIGILIVIVIGLGIRLYFVNKELQNNKTIYCVMEDSESKLEIYYDFKDSKVYRYTVISTNGYSSDINIDAYADNMSATNLKYKGVTNKVWYDGNEFVTTEIYDLNTITEDEFKEMTGMSKTELQKKSRSEIIDSYLPIVNSDASFKCK
jgi:hypothetical protein